MLSLKEIEEKTEINLNIDCNSVKALSDLKLPHTIVTDIGCNRILVQKSGSSGEEPKEVVTEIVDRVSSDQRP